MYRFSLPVALLMLGLAAVPVSAEEKQPMPEPGMSMHVVSEVPRHKMVNTTYLGITAERVSPALNSQLKLPKGLGLVVTHVADDSPSQAAGIQKHDVLHKLDDQLLVNFEQLAILIRLHEPGDTVTLNLIRSGENQKITATLAEHEVPEISITPGMFFPNITAPINTAVFTTPKYESEKLKTEHDRVIPDHYTMPDNIVPNERFKLSMKDGDHTIELDTATDDGPYLKVTDAEGNVLYDGIWDEKSSQQPELSEEVIEKLHQMINSPWFGEHSGG